tara:strand:- start:156 stop:731 length:576 start_codon:yes stop_codon:yes gene_type:complete
MKLILENWRKYLAEAQLQKVDWKQSRTLPPGAAEARENSLEIWKKWKAEEKRLRKQFISAMKANVIGEMSNEEYNRIADQHADMIMDPLGETMVAMLKIYHQAGFVPPKEVVQGANQWRSGKLEQIARLQGDAIAAQAIASGNLDLLDAAGVKTPEDLAQKIHAGEIEMIDLMDYVRALDKKKAAQQTDKQ